MGWEYSPTGVMDPDRVTQSQGVGVSLAVADVHASLQPAGPVTAVSFDAIYEEQFNYVWNCVRRLGVPEKDLEDACHDVFVAVYKHLP